MTECNQIADEMRVSPAKVSRMAKKGIDAGWLDKKGREYLLKDRCSLRVIEGGLK